MVQGQNCGTEFVLRSTQLSVCLCVCVAPNVPVCIATESSSLFLFLLAVLASDEVWVSFFRPCSSRLALISISSVVDAKAETVIRLKIHTSRDAVRIRQRYGEHLRC